MEDCTKELHSLLQEEVKSNKIIDLTIFHSFFLLQRLAGATLLVFANKQDLPGAMTADEIKEVLCFTLIDYTPVTN